MKNFRLSALALAGAAVFGQAHAIDLIAIGQMDPTIGDKSGTSAPLENGVHGDLLGGVGSALAWAGGSTFLALPDRGPNATPWNDAVDDTASYIPRFHTFELALTATPANGLPYTLTPTLKKTTLLSSPVPLTYGPVGLPHGVHQWFFSGRSDNFDPAKDSGAKRDARLDPEGMRVSRDGKSIFITDEYGPYVYEFDRATGIRTKSFKLPDSFHVANKSAQGDVEIAGNTSGRVANKGMEGLAITPDGKTLVGFEQGPLIQDGGDGGRMNRIITIDRATGETHQYAYDNYLDETKKTYNSSELLAINSHEFLVLERDGKGLGDDSTAVIKRLYKVDIAGAFDVSDLSGEAALLAHAVPKTLFLDIKAALNAHGITDDKVPSKLEGAAFGEDITEAGVVKHTLYIGNDNDFLPVTAGGLANPNQWFVFSFTDADLGGSKFEPQIIKK